MDPYFVTGFLSIGEVHPIVGLLLALFIALYMSILYSEQTNQFVYVIE